jgi:hypothetical protein
MRTVISVVVAEKQRKNVAPSEGNSIVRMKMFAGQGVNVRRMNAVAVSILRAYAVTGVRRRRYVHIKDYVKESWMGVIYVIRVPLIALARSV